MSWNVDMLVLGDWKNKRFVLHCSCIGKCSHIHWMKGWRRRRSRRRRRRRLRFLSIIRESKKYSRLALKVQRNAAVQQNPDGDGWWWGGGSGGVGVESVRGMGGLTEKRTLSRSGDG